MRRFQILVFIVLLLSWSCVSESTNTARESIKIEPKVLKPDHPLIGKWQVTEASFVPFEHISYCENLDLGSIFEFKTNRTLSVFPAHTERECTKKQYFTWNINAIEIRESDMIFQYPVIAFSEDSLIFKIERVPSIMWDSLRPKTEDEANQIIEKGIIVTLEKIENGG